jgi:hypothetical protein
MAFSVAKRKSIYDVKISGFTRSSICDISRLRVTVCSFLHSPITLATFRPKYSHQHAVLNATSNSLRKGLKLHVHIIRKYGKVQVLGLAVIDEICVTKK